ncbi:NTPase KAP family P-loop domain-containing protein 1 isoform X1 [Saimiri boliviensis]|uniref:NTPase KAP family P-loop domain-containing protein 1 isoform X1 n=1 Tax=Saimiri boliviensis TaxID=27679 RepID=UPI00193E9508|nr:NTPase KAP family P-loop domain-containing protein 1 isoform X1 [Saimiri boliviensis boliviensis]XP_039323062.1 NTPase KAP family P-loop domain-containing protein 1 isoform X1 [Saimiri boliviensis boliviensis]XP_039323063.1 NTPase KAP family P-loop domain-containing protein 1 isoform X1 [Saimiri boliviensis boliviensis]XP_039323064.1 NTPase KAP family P-loop domain-containing protein 1 isoform X1 [Saimiri boliviensis boliviensis]XP_039323065.1 NTPase KAP family P-loop domain-containing prote
MHKHYKVHFAKDAQTPSGHYFWDPELGHQKGCCHPRRQDSAALRAHGPCRPSPQSHWQLAYHSHRAGGSGWRRGPPPSVQQKQWQPQPPPPSPMRQRLCPIHRAQKGLPATSTVPRGPAGAPQAPPLATTALATASSGTALRSAASVLLEPSEPTDARPLPAPAACGSFTYSSDILTEDDVYCSCLAKTLCHVPVPVTVGFYAPFGCRLHMMLDKITALMQQEAAQRESEELQHVQWRPRAVSGWGVPQLLWYLVFLQPIITEVHLRRRNVQFLFIRFSAWQYAGTDKLWAGLVTTLCEGIRHHYGALPFSVYSVLGNKPATRQGCCHNEWHCRRRVCLGLLVLLAALGLGVGLLYLSLGGHAPGHGSPSGSLLKVFGGAATTLSGSGLLMAVYSVGKHLFVSQRKKIERLVSREKFGSQLGFMCEVKKEVELLTDFLSFLEIYQRRRLRVVLEVTGLDTCYPERVVGVLNAINTLLSDSHAPFIFILVVDPSILAACLESAGNMKGTADNGYLFLNRTVTLPFSVPIMGRRTKLQFLHDAVQSRDDLLYREITRKPGAAGGGGGESAQLLAVQTQVGPERGQGRIDAEAARRIQEALFCLHDERDCLYEYVPDNVVSMRRIVNTVPITVRLLQQQQQQGDFGGPTPRQAVAWVVLANQWPCRLSWALQCLEDRQQTGGAPEGRARLWDVFRDNSRELHTMTKALQNVLDLDGDPELFERFLGADFPFTVAEAQSLLRCTVNLDHSIRRRMGLIRAVSTLKPPSPPKSPARDAPHAAHRANSASRASPSGRAAGQAGEGHHAGDLAHAGQAMASGLSTLLSRGVQARCALNGGLVRQQETRASPSAQIGE